MLSLSSCYCSKLTRTNPRKIRPFSKRVWGADPVENRVCRMWGRRLLSVVRNFLAHITVLQFENNRFKTEMLTCSTEYINSIYLNLSYAELSGGTFLH